jgi:hypothetical protein
MKRCLIMYHHGLGDVIMLTPTLRQLHNEGYEIDLMCREAVGKSKLLENCQYVDELITIENPWRAPLPFKEQLNENVKRFDQLKKKYDRSCAILTHVKDKNKIEYNAECLGVELETKNPEVFISNENRSQAKNWLKKNKMRKYVFQHTQIEFHECHNWNAVNWIRFKFPDCDIFDSGFDGKHYRIFDDINVTFEIARKADHRVLSSSVMVHACDAMNCNIDIINYGRPDRKVWPLDQEKVLRIRENGRYIKGASVCRSY